MKDDTQEFCFYRGERWLMEIELEHLFLETENAAWAIFPRNSTTQTAEANATVLGSTATVSIPPTTTAQIGGGDYDIYIRAGDLNREIAIARINVLTPPESVRDTSDIPDTPTNPTNPTVSYQIYTGKTNSAFTPALTNLTAATVSGSSVSVSIETGTGGTVWILTPLAHTLAGIHNNDFSADDALAAFTHTTATISTTEYNIYSLSDARADLTLNYTLRFN